MRLVVVVLSGGDGDGTDGVQEARSKGRTVIVQDPGLAQVPDMPRSTIATGTVNEILPMEKIAPLIVDIVARGSSDRLPAPWNLCKQSHDYRRRGVVDTTRMEIIERMVDNRVRRLPVIDAKGEVLGVIPSMILPCAFAATRNITARPTARWAMAQAVCKH